MAKVGSVDVLLATAAKEVVKIDPARRALAPTVIFEPGYSSCQTSNMVIELVYLFVISQRPSGR